MAKEQKDMDKMYRRVKKKFTKNKKVYIHRKKSESVSKLFKNNYFDWMFLDGNHSYEYVKKDIELYYPKLKRGGYILGDDYWWRIREGLPVKKAVDEMKKKKNLKMLSLQAGVFLLQK